MSTIQPYFNAENVRKYIQDPMETFIEHIDGDHLIRTLSKYFKVKTKQKLFNSIIEELQSDPTKLKTLSDVCHMEIKDFVELFVSTFFSEMDRSTTKLFTKAVSSIEIQ